MSADLPAIDLPLARYRLECVAQTPVHLPAFAGSTLRGLFGMALRKALCSTGASHCQGCALQGGCAYASIFEPQAPGPGTQHKPQEAQQIPRPYVIEPPAWGPKTYAAGESFAFHLVLAGHALNQLALILWAFDRGLSQGIGKGQGNARLHRVTHIGTQETQVLATPGSTLQPHPTGITAPTHLQARAATLHFDSPLRLQNNGRRATAEEHTPRRLLTALMRRTSLMARHHGPQPLAHDFKALAAQAETLQSHKDDLHWRDWSRYSSRQQRSMDLGGVVGPWHLAGELAPFLPFLHLGQWLHVGKEAVFGLGGYRLELHA